MNQNSISRPNSTTFYLQMYIRTKYITDCLNIDKYNKNTFASVGPKPTG